METFRSYMKQTAFTERGRAVLLGVMFTLCSCYVRVMFMLCSCYDKGKIFGASNVRRCDGNNIYTVRFTTYCVGPVAQSV
jgi:hypothetical protein